MIAEMVEEPLKQGLIDLNIDGALITAFIGCFVYLSKKAKRKLGITFDLIMFFNGTLK